MIEALEFKHVWMVVGPVLSGCLLRVAHKKYRQSGTILRTYASNDAAVFFQLWAHFIGNIAFAVVNFPLVGAALSCTVRKWVGYFLHISNILRDCVCNFLLQWFLDTCSHH